MDAAMSTYLLARDACRDTDSRLNIAFLRVFLVGRTIDYGKCGHRCLGRILDQSANGLNSRLKVQNIATQKSYWIYASDVIIKEEKA